MAKRHRVARVTASFHYLLKETREEGQQIESGFSTNEFDRVVQRLKDTSPINLDDEEEVRKIKRGENLPFLSHAEISPTLHFGCFEGAYYGHEYRNSKYGKIDADSLNLRKFHYLISHTRDGKIIIGAQYNGNYGDYDGLRRCLTHILDGNGFDIKSRTFSSISHEIGGGQPVELKVNIRKQNRRLGGASLFSSSAVLAIKKSDYGADFASDVKRTLLPALKGNAQDRKAALAKLMSESELMEIGDDDIEGCTLIVRNDGGQRTIYLLGDSSFATRFPLEAAIDLGGMPNETQVRSEMCRILNGIVIPGMRK